jgi:CHAT domain
MGRRHRTGRAARVAAALTALLVLAVSPAAQHGPTHWQQFHAWRQELTADASATLAKWGDRAEARLLWMHSYVTADRPDVEFAAWFARDAAATLHLLHAILRQRPTIDWGPVLAEALQFVERLKSGGGFDAAAAFVTDVLAWLGNDHTERLEFLLQQSECQRRAYRWDQAARALDEAEATVAVPASAVPLHVQRAALLLARGLPDLAIPEVEAAERASDDPWHAAQALFVRLRLEHSLRRPERAMSRLREFLAAPVAPAIADDERWPPRLAQLRIRAALAVLADPAAHAPDEDEVVGWLKAAIADPATTLDERILARTVLITHLLDHLRLEGVSDQLEAAAREIAAGATADLDERRLAVATLALRHARLAGIQGEALRARAGELEHLWHLLVDRWHEQPISRVGEGPLFFGDCRRAFVELLRYRLVDDDAVTAAASVLDEVVRASATGSLARQFGAVAQSTAAIRSRLCGDQAGVLVLVPGHEASIAIAIDATSTTVHVLEVGALALDEARRQLLRQVERARQGEDPAGLAAAAEHCSALLLPPAVALRLTGWQGLAIVGLESLGYLPFELLPDTRGERLGVGHAVSYLPSLPVATWLAEHRPVAPASRAPRVRVLACPDAPVPSGAADQPQPLPFRDADLAPWRAACRDVDLEVLRGAEASRLAAFDAGREVDVVQVLAHGMRDETRDDPQGILLGDGVITWPAEIEPLACPQYVFLNVCRAGRGRMRRGDDGRHLLSGAALLAGARGVVLPVTDVGYRATLAFAADVHRALWQDRVGFAEALRRARVAAMSRGDRDGLEAFLFHLVGLGEAPLALAGERHLEHRRWQLPAGLGIAGLLVAGVLLRNRLRRKRRRDRC